MNERETIISWNEAAELYKSNPSDLSVVREAAGKFEKLLAARPFQSVSKLAYNAAIFYRLLDELPMALKYLNQSVERDPHNAMAYFQRASLFYKLEKYPESAKDCQKCIESMRQVTVIDYSQLGLKCKIYQHEAIFNEAVCHLRLNNKKYCIETLQEVQSLIGRDPANSPKTVNVESSLQSVQTGSGRLQWLDRGLDRIYTPPVSKVKNVAKKDYLGKAQVVSSVQSGDTFSGFVGPKLVAKYKEKKKAPPDRPESPRPMTPTPQLPKDSKAQFSTISQLISEGLIANASRFSEKPEAPTHPPPKASSRPVPVPRVVVEKPSNEQTEIVRPQPTKPPIVAKPKMCQIEFLCGETSSCLSLPVSTNYLRLMDHVKKTLGFEEGTFSLWYMNRHGTYTAIENQEVVEHVWRWKVVDNRLTIYVFGV